MSLSYEEFSDELFGILSLQYVSPDEDPVLQYESLVYPQFNYVVELVNEEFDLDPDNGHVTFLKSLGYGESIPSEFTCNVDSNKAIFYSLKSPIYLSGNITSNCQLDLTIVGYMGVVLDKVGFSKLSKLTVISGNAHIESYQLVEGSADKMSPVVIKSLSSDADTTIISASMSIKGVLAVRNNLSIYQTSVNPQEIIGGGFLKVGDVGEILVSSNLTMQTGDLENRGVIKSNEDMNLTSSGAIENKNAIVSHKDLSVMAKSFSNTRYVYVKNNTTLRLSEHFLNEQASTFTSGGITSTDTESNRVELFKNRGRIESTKSSIEINADRVELECSDYELKARALPRYEYREGSWYLHCFTTYENYFESGRPPSLSVILTAKDFTVDAINLSFRYSSIYSNEDIKLHTSSEVVVDDIDLWRTVVCNWGDDNIYGYSVDSGRKGAIKYINQAIYPDKPLKNVERKEFHERIFESYSSHIHAAGNITGALGSISHTYSGEVLPDKFKELIDGNNNQVAIYGATQLNDMLPSHIKATNLNPDDPKLSHIGLLQGCGFILTPSAAEQLSFMYKSMPIDFKEYLLGKNRALINFDDRYLIEGSEIYNKKHSFALSIQNNALPTLGDHIYYDNLFKDAVFKYLGNLRGVDPFSVFDTLKRNCEDTQKSYGYNLPLTSISEDFIANLYSPVICPVITTECKGLSPKCIDYKLIYNDKVIREYISEDLISSEKSIDLTITGDAMISNIRAGESIEIKAGGEIFVTGKVRGENIGLESSGNTYFLGEIDSLEDLSIKALNVGIAGELKAGKDLTLSAIEKLAISTLVKLCEYSGYHIHEVRSHILSEASIKAGGAINLSSGGDMLIAGVEVIGNSVYIKSGEKLYIIPVSIYNELTQWGKRYYESHQSLQLHRSTLMTNSGDVQIEVNGESLFSGVMTKSGQAIMLTSNSKVDVDNPSEYELHALTVKSSGLLGTSIGAKKTTQSSYVSNLIGSVYEAVTSIIVSSFGDQTWSGIELVASSVELESGTAEHEAMVLFLAAYENTKYELITEESRFKFSTKGGKFSWAEYTKAGQVTGSSRAFPTIIRVEDSFYVHSSGKFYAVSPQITTNSKTGEGTVTIDASHIQVDSAPNIDFAFAMMRKGTTGIGFKAEGGELSVGVYAAYEDTSSSLTKLFHSQARVAADIISLNADRIEDVNILYQAQKLEENAVIIYHGVSKDVILQSQNLQSIEAGVKLGVKSNLGAIKSNIETIADTKDSPESLISSAFAMWSLYNNVLTLLSSSTNHGISGGVWFYVEGQISESKASLIAPKPVIFDVNEFNSTSDELKLVSTQYQAYKGYIESKYLDINAERTTYDSSAKSYFANAEIPLFGIGNIIPTIGGGFSKSKSHEEQSFTANIFVSDALTLNINGKARIEGAVIEASSLEASFNELLIASMLDVSKQIQRGASVTLGLNMDKLTDVPTLNQVGAEIGNRKAHAVETITALLGKDAAHIVVANALRMNGAMIACAERDENGEFTDHGNLTLEVGKLFVEHIQIFDEGKSLQASVAMGGNLFVKDKAGNRTPYMTLNGAVSAHSYDGVVYGTIGEGEITVAGESELEKANRDVTRSVTYEENFNMDPIKFYYADPDNSQLQFPGSIEEFKKSFVKAAFVKTKLSSLNQDLEAYIDDFVREEQAGGMCLTRDSKAILETYQNEMANIMTDMQEQTGQLDESQNDQGVLTEGGMCMMPEADSADNYDAIHTLIGSSDLYKTQESKIRDERIDKVKQDGIAHGNLKPLAQGINLAAKKYIEFAQKHPFLAERALDLFTIAVRAVAGLISGGPAGAAGGALSGVGSALACEAVNKVAGKYIKSAMDSLSSKAVPELMAMDGSLTKEEADLLVRIAVLGALGGKELADGIKLLSKSVKGVSVMKPAMAGGADLDNVDTHILEKKGHEGLAKTGGDGSKLADDVASHQKPNVINDARVASEIFKYDGSALSNIALKKIEGAGFNKADYTRFGEVVLELAETPEIKAMVNKWGVGAHGSSQLLEHTIGVDNSIKRLSGIERRAGLEVGSLSKALSTNKADVLQGLKEFDKLADRILNFPDRMMDFGNKKVYWLEPIINDKRGLALIRYDNKYQTLKIIPKQYFNNKYTSK